MVKYAANEYGKSIFTTLFIVDLKSVAFYLYFFFMLTAVNPCGKRNTDKQ